ncbi:MAG: hypothetical protein KBT46_03940 [Ruminococcus sp.]|nr:hypothetical protein [Candidatus Copronaster equi]
MKYVFEEINIVAKKEVEIKAAQLFSEELEMRTGKKVQISDVVSDCSIELVVENESNDESFKIEHCRTKIKITAHRLRGLIYGCGWFIRKAVVQDGNFVLLKNISCEKKPSMKIRGHQLSYTDMNNTYEKWDEKQYERYIRDLMMFGTNTIEATTTKNEKRTHLMKYTFKEALDKTSKICDELDLDFSVWHPLDEKMSEEENIADMNSHYEGTPKLDVVFPPGGDPGDMLAEDFLDRCINMKKELIKTFPNVEMWPSAQAPHQYPDWGEKFTKKMAELPDEIDGLIYGPNHAMPLDEMRRVISDKYQLRFYPDIAHNVRCEVPVHFNRSDWHYAFASTLSREAVNPRPTEYRLLHRITRRYFIGSVTYSEGVNDDVNKFVWSDLDFDFNCNTRETLNDYSRAFFCGVDSEKLTDALFGLETNWIGDPAENANIDYVYSVFSELAKNKPELMSNWRFVLHLFRAQCDKIVRDRRLFETSLIEEAKTEVFLGNDERAKEILSTDFSDGYKKMRSNLFELAEILFDLIGIQLDVEHFYGMNEERGCTLDTIDNQITDRMYLLNKINAGENLSDYFARNIVENDEYYFSFAEHGFDVCGEQVGEFYMNFCGEDNKDGSMPVCMTNVYDHFNFKTKIAGLTGGDYKLRITYKSRPNDKIKHHKITINSKVLYDGVQFGGTRDEAFEKKFLAKGYESVVYDVDKSFFVNGCAELEITEPLDGFQISEFWFVKA